MDSFETINRLPLDVFVCIPHFFTQNKEGWPNMEGGQFFKNKPLINMTHVCRTWRHALLSTPSLWTEIDFSMSTESQQEAFLRRSRNLPLDVYQDLETDVHIEPFMSTTRDNSFRIRELRILTSLVYFGSLLRTFSTAAPKLKCLELANDTTITDMDINLPTIFGGRMPELKNLVLDGFGTNLRGFYLPSLVRFIFSTGTEISVQDLASFFERCPSLESINLSLTFTPQPVTTPSCKRVGLAALKKLKLDEMACASGLLDALTLPNCTMMALIGGFTGAAVGEFGLPAARIHASSIDHLSTMRGITKAVAMPNSCVFSGSGGVLRFWSSGIRSEFDADFFTSFSPISVLQIRDLWVGQRTERSFGHPRCWKQTTFGVDSAFKVLTRVEELTIVSCETKPFLVTLGTTATGILLPGLRKLTIYVGCGDLDIPTLIKCAKLRKEHSLLIGAVSVVWEKDPGANVMQEMKLLKHFVGELIQRVGDTPTMSWDASF